MDDKRYYVLCPSNLITGGPDALHQMVFYLKQIGKNAEIVYVKIMDDEVSIPEPYKIYVSTYLKISDVTDDDSNVIICAETYIHYTYRFRKSKIYIWWLSVDNNEVGTSFKKKALYALGLPARLIIHPVRYFKFGNEIIRNNLFKKRYNFKNERNNIYHICASYYAYDYVSRSSKKDVQLCVEPISLVFLKEYAKWSGESQREDIVLYNPKKSGKQIELLDMYDKTIKFVPLIGYDQNGLIEMYKKAKLFVDFGPFPGAERMPKEATLFGCAIITGKRGASAYYEDVPIPEEYKFSFIKGQEAIICKKIKFCLSHYSSIISDFNVYKETVLNLESNFVCALKRIFD